MFIEATLTSSTAVDLDFELRTTSGQVLDSSTSSTATESVFGSVQPNTRYILRVLSWAHGPAQFRIVSDQLLPNDSQNGNAGTRTIGENGAFSSSGSTGGSSLTRLVRFTVNPLTRNVTAQILN